jgi:hypothetical protein
MSHSDYAVNSIIKDLLAYPLTVIQKGSPLIAAIDAILEMSYEGECVAIAQDLIYNGDERYIKSETLEELYRILYHDDKMGLSLSHSLRWRTLARVITEISYEYALPGKSHIVAHFTTASELVGKVVAFKFFGVNQYVWRDVLKWITVETGCRGIEVMDFYVKRHGRIDCGVELTAIYKYLLHTGRVAAHAPEPLPPTASSTTLF